MLDNGRVGRVANCATQNGAQQHTHTHTEKEKRAPQKKEAATRMGRCGREGKRGRQRQIEKT